MTPEQEADLIEDMAAEICYAVFVPPIDYGGPEVYWRTVVSKRKEAYRREARAALRIVKPVLWDEALEEAAKSAERITINYSANEMASRIRALKSKGQKP